MNSTEQTTNTETGLPHAEGKPVHFRTDLTGRRFGHLVVLNYAGHQRKQCKRNRHYWRCRCDCGEEVELVQHNLLDPGKRADGSPNNVTSCGCVRRGNHSKNWKGFGKISGRYWSDVKGRARDKKFEFNITIQQAWELLVAQNMTCALSGLPIIAGNQDGARQTCSLDRIDSSRGYTIDNVQWLHKDVNMMKNSHDQEYFVGICRSIAETQARR